MINTKIDFKNNTPLLSTRRDFIENNYAFYLQKNLLKPAE